MDKKYPINIVLNKGSEIITWESVADFKVKKRVHSFKPYFYIRSNSYESEYNTIYGDPVEKYVYDSVYMKDDILENFNKEDIFESDIKNETRWLIDNFHNEQTTRKQHKIRTWFVDIENLVGDKGFPDPEKGENVITVITIHDNATNKIISFALPPEGYIEEEPNKNILLYSNEQKMLSDFIKFVKKSQVQILSGWHSEAYDIPHIINRSKRLLGDDVVRELSPVKKVYKQHAGGWTISGISHLDYLLLYKKFEINSRESYKLDYIGNLELGKKKLEFEQDTLDQLYYEDFKKYLDYNRQDVRLLVELDKKKKYIELTQELTKSAFVPLEDVYFNTRLVDGFILSRLKPENKVVPDKPKNVNKSESHFAGAYVQDPVPGLYDWVITLDLISLYPSIIRSLNMSPETIIQKKLNVFEQDECFRASNGSCYSKGERGIFPRILDELFNKRVEFKKLMNKAKLEGKNDLFDFYWMRQYNYKILLNSVYGYFGAPETRFFNKSIAEGITMTGQEIIKFSGNYFNKQDNDIKCIAADTDSCFLYVQKFNENDIQYYIKKGKELQQEINNEVNQLSIKKFNTDENHHFEFKFEKVCKTILLIAKKRYAYYLGWEEGFESDKVGITGIEVVRSDTPFVCREFMRTVLDMILKKKDKNDIDKFVLDFKKEYKKLDLIQKAIPVGVKGIKKYTSPSGHPRKGTPAHTKGAINFNHLIAKNKSHIFPIKSGEKIKWWYVKNNVVETMAMVDYLSEVDKYSVDDNRMLQRLVDGKIDILYGAINWAMPVNKRNTLSDDIFG